MRHIRSLGIRPAFAALMFAGCGLTTEPSVASVQGRWLLKQYDGQLLPFVQRASSTDSLWLLADTLVLDGHGGARRSSGFRGWTPARPWAVSASVDEKYRVSGDSVIVYDPFCGDCGPSGLSDGVGRVTTSGLSFPKQGGDSARLYVLDLTTR